MNRMFTLCHPPRLPYINKQHNRCRQVNLYSTGTYCLFIDKTFVVAFDQLAFDLLHRIQRNTDYD